jgi:F-type H+-transporting ATPase subunit b
MNLTVTIIIQGIAFFAVALAVMRWIWPPLLGAIDARRAKIAEGLAAADKGQKDLDEAKVKAQEIVREARDKAVQIVDQASKRANEIVEEAKHAAIAEGQRLIAQANDEIALEVTRARESLRRQVATLAVQGASHLLEREIDAKTHAELLDKLDQELVSG